MIKKKYRLFLLFSSIISADTMSDFMKKITEVLNDFSINVLETEHSKPFALAYAINGTKEAIQVVCEIELNDNHIKNLIMSEFRKIITQYCREYLLRLEILNENHIVFSSSNFKKETEEKASMEK